LSCSPPYPSAAHPAASATCPQASSLAHTDRQHSSDGSTPPTPPRRTASWGQRAYSALKLCRDWGSNNSLGSLFGSEGGLSSSTGSGSTSSSRDTSSGGCSVDLLGSGSAGSLQTVTAGSSVLVGSKVGGPVDACADDDTDIFFDAQEVDCAVWV
jgi:hypothetical protein